MAAASSALPCRSLHIVLITIDAVAQSILRVVRGADFATASATIGPCARLMAGCHAPALARTRMLCGVAHAISAISHQQSVHRQSGRTM